jgi:phage anti-repressor protein
LAFADIVMNTIHIKEFIRTGKFGTISIGSKKNDVVNALGAKFHFADCGETQIIKYGWYEFFYWTESESIFGIQNDHLQADCTTHEEMIDYKSELWTIDKWFLEVNKNITFGQIEKLLTEEGISFDIVPAYNDSDENIIKCKKSGVTFDFAKEYRIVEYNEKGEFKNWKEFIEKDQSNFILKGIRLFGY